MLAVLWETLGGAYVHIWGEQQDTGEEVTGSKGQQAESPEARGQLVRRWSAGHRSVPGKFLPPQSKESPGAGGARAHPAVLRVSKGRWPRTLMNSGEGVSQVRRLGSFHCPPEK